jgi:hypothetical protein
MAGRGGRSNLGDDGALLAERLLGLSRAMEVSATSLDSRLDLGQDGDGIDAPCMSAWGKEFPCERI